MMTGTNDEGWRDMGNSYGEWTMPDPRFYFEEFHTGQWHPRTAPERPIAPKPNSGKRRMREIRPVPAQLAHLPLDTLRAYLSPDSDLYIPQHTDHG